MTDLDKIVDEIIENYGRDDDEGPSPARRGPTPLADRPAIPGPPPAGHAWHWNDVEQEWQATVLTTPRDWHDNPLLVIIVVVLALLLVSGIVKAVTGPPKRDHVECGDDFAGQPSHCE